MRKIIALVWSHLLVASAFVSPRLGSGAVPNNVYSSESIQTELMCGLIAIVEDVWDESNGGKSHELLQPDALKETTKILHHRGPDGYQTMVQDQFAMGHTRLAIVDPDNRQADMPFSLDYGDTIIHLVANGEIYNHQDVYRRLEDSEGWDSTKRISQSDCEVIGHAYHTLGGPATAAMLDGMFAFTVVEQDKASGAIRNVFCARDPVGIKPLYYGSKNGHYVFSSELKALVGHVDPESVIAVPAGHYWSPKTDLQRFYAPEWLMNDDHSPWKETEPTQDEIREAFTHAVKKRMMADVEYGFFLSGGIDSCVVAHDLLPLYRAEREARGDFSPINTYTVGMRNSPDVMAAKAMVEALGGSKYINHHIREFTPDEVFELIPKIIYHMETYEAELIRSSIPNWLLAERAAEDVKMVLTGEGSDEIFAGYLYFSEAGSATQVQNELKRIYGMLGNINLHRTDRMTMAHGLEARVPFLDTNFTKLIMSIDPSRKMVDAEAVKSNSRGREKTFLRELFEAPNDNGHTIPTPVLWRAKAMQCEGVGEDWVSILQNRISSLVTDEELENAPANYPLNTPQTKEEVYYRKIFDDNFKGMEHVVTPWEGGGRAMGAAWKTNMYTREGLKNVDLLSHSLQEAKGVHGAKSADARVGACTRAANAGFTELGGILTSGGDDRTLINPATGANKYHLKPVPIGDGHIFRGSCTGNPPTARGYKAVEELFGKCFEGETPEGTEEAIDGVFQQQRERIAKVLDLPEGCEVILCPSGSDAEYLPIVIAKALSPDSTITNGSTQLQETGAGSSPASLGRYFSPYAPLVGQVDDPTDHLEGFADVEGEGFPARERDGSVVDAKVKMDGFVEQALADGKYPIVHTVFGGKTGVRDEVVPRTLGSGDIALGVVDACQMRFSNDELQQWLKDESVVLITASKFYQAPPFCGAVIIPPSMANKLRNLEAPKEMLLAGGLGAFLTHKEIPKSLSGWREELTLPDANIGLALRWEAGLAGMEALASVPDDERDAAVKEWAESVVELVNREDTIDAWSMERSIVSIRVSNGKGGWLDVEELRKLFRWMSLDVSELVASASPAEASILSAVTYIGQPVDVSDSHAIVRIALGVESMLSYLEDPQKTLLEDSVVVRKIATLGKYFEALQEAEAQSATT